MFDDFRILSYFELRNVPIKIENPRCPKKGHRDFRGIFLKFQSENLIEFLGLRKASA